ncbi:MAG: GTP-binding protein [Bacillota bacterium]|nr:GTP-binding protein [Bacillota bacterium]
MSDKKPKTEFEYVNLLGSHHGQSHSHKHNHKHHHLEPKKTKEEMPTIPATIIGGFLGSGKTSLVNHILENSGEKRIDIVVREFGSIPIDDMLIHVEPERIHAFPGVSMHYDPQLMIYGFMDRLHEDSEGEGFDHLLMESSGMDEPEYLMKLFFLGNMREEYELTSYITLIDCEFGHLNIDEYPLVVEQIGYADIILLNKVDLIEKKEIESIEKRVSNINRMAKIYRTEYGRVDLSKILKVDLYNQLKDLNEQNNVKEEGTYMDKVKTVVLSEEEPMDKEKINKWIDKVFKDDSIKLLRSKGFFNFKNEDYRYEFQAVRKSFHSKSDRLWDENDDRKSTVVFIGEGIDEEQFKKEFKECV